MSPVPAFWCLPRNAPARARSWVSACLVLLAALAGASPAEAQLTPTAAAEQLFLEGRTLMAQGQTARACDKFAASYALDFTAYGTLLNLALCHEQLGKTATAWAEFRTVAAASEESRVARARVAREHEEALLPLLSHVTVVVPDEARAAGLQVRLDEAPLEPAAWGTAIPIDPGPHVVRASAPGRSPSTHSITIGPRADRRRVVLGPLRPTTSDEGEHGRGGRWVLGVALGLTGVAAIGTGLGFGLAASSQYESAKALCRPDGTCPTSTVRDEAVDKRDSAALAASVATVAVSAGALVAAGGLVLALTAPGPSTRRGGLRRLGAEPMAGGARLVVGGSF